VIAKWIRLGFVVALLVVGAGLLVACGDDKGEYAADVRDIVQPLQNLGAELQEGGSQRERIAQLEDAQGSIEDAADDLEGLDPPEEVQSEHDDYVTKLRALAGDVGAVIDAVEAQDQDAARDAFTQLQGTAEQVQESGDALEQAVE
jgi:hypothetical protein